MSRGFSLGQSVFARGAISMMLAIPLLVMMQSGPAQSAVSPGIPSISAGANHVCVLEFGGVKCWGRNSDGQLGVGDTNHRGDEPNEMGGNLAKVDLGTNVNIASITSGASHSCALLSTGGVKCWGRNSDGQLGVGDTNDRGDGPNEMGNTLPIIDVGSAGVVVAIDAGHSFTCALLSTGAVKCWGDNQYGQLGLGDTNNRGDGPNEMGDNLPTIDLGVGATAVSLSVGPYHACALLSTGVVKCWGDNPSGQLGLGDTNDRGDGPNEMGDNLPVVDLGAGAVIQSLALGEEHTCALLSTGAVKCWGLNASTQLGLGDVSNRGGNPNEMGDNLPAVNLGSGVTGTSIQAGKYHTCVLLADKKVKCWGANNAGQLGLGDVSNRGGTPNEMGDNLPHVELSTGDVVSYISTGEDFSCVVLSTAVVKCWGKNLYGQLGAGDTNYRGDNPNEMGDSLTTSYQLLRATQTITFGSLSHRVLTTATFSVTATSDSALPITFDTSSQTVCRALGDQVILLTTGTCSVIARQSGNATYQPATEIVQSFKVLSVPRVKPKNQISIVNLARKWQISIPKGVTVTGTVSSKLRSICRTSGKQLLAVGGGRCTVKLKLTPKKGKSTYQTVLVNVTQTFGLRRNSSVSLVNASAAAGMTTGKGFTVSAVVAKTSRKFCKVSSSKIIGQKTGRCVIVVTVSSVHGATSSKTLRTTIR